MRLLATLCVIATLIAGCGPDPGGGKPAPPEAVPADSDGHAASCEDYEGDALTDPCDTLPDGPPPVQEACSRPSYEFAVRSEIDGGLRVGDAACDGEKLVLDFVIDSCPAGEDRPSNCSRAKRAYFVRQEDRWRVVTYTDPQRCEELAGDLRTRFTELCRQLEADDR